MEKESRAEEARTSSGLCLSHAKEMMAGTFESKV